MRRAKRMRHTEETAVSLWLELDGKGESDAKTGMHVFDRLLGLMMAEGSFDLALRTSGEPELGGSWTAEGIGEAMGEAYRAAAGDLSELRCTGGAVIPVKDALALAAVDFTEEPYCRLDMEIPANKLGDFETENAQYFFQGFSRAAGLTMHVRLFEGGASRDALEAVFRAAGAALRDAVQVYGEPGTASEEAARTVLSREEEDRAPAEPTRVIPAQDEERRTQAIERTQTIERTQAIERPQAADRMPAAERMTDPYEDETRRAYEAMRYAPERASSKDVTQTMTRAELEEAARESRRELYELPKSMRRQTEEERLQEAKESSTGELERELREKGLL